MIRPLSKEQQVNLNLKATLAEIQAIKSNAKKYTRGNVSAWVRFAAIHFQPTRDELKEK